MARFLEFVANHPFLFLAAAILLALLIAGEVRRLTRRYQELEPLQAVRLINDGALLIDLRSVDAFRAGHIAGARAIAPDELPQKIATLAKEREQPFLLYCDSGLASGRAALLLTKLGFERVHTLKGGLAAWRRESLPVVKE